MSDQNVLFDQYLFGVCVNLEFGQFASASHTQI